MERKEKLGPLRVGRVGSLLKKKLIDIGNSFYKQRFKPFLNSHCLINRMILLLVNLINCHNPLFRLANEKLFIHNPSYKSNVKVRIYYKLQVKI